MIDTLISEAALALLLGISRRSLQRMRMEGSGPRFVRATAGDRHGRVLYRQADIEQWLAERSRSSTSDPGAAGPAAEAPTDRAPRKRTRASPSTTPATG